MYKPIPLVEKIGILGGMMSTKTREYSDNVVYYFSRYQKKYCNFPAHGGTVIKVAC